MSQVEVIDAEGLELAVLQMAMSKGAGTPEDARRITQYLIEFSKLYGGALSAAPTSQRRALFEFIRVAICKVPKHDSEDWDEYQKRVSQEVSRFLEQGQH